MHPNQAKHAQLSHEALLNTLRYDRETGKFYWNTCVGTKCKPGDSAGSVQRRCGYAVVMINSQIYMAHRLAWFYVNGEWPEKQIDHINGNRLDNRISNLREASNAQNQRNAKRRKDNTTGFKGVSLNRKLNKFSANIRVDGRLIGLGLYHTAEEAHDAYVAASARHFGEFSNSGSSYEK